jgi:DNA-binding transcriptional MerR regulator
MYDNKAVKRLEQVLILRKLGISVKDIQRIFATFATFGTFGSEVVLEVLNKKVTDIDEEVALLHELKEIVLKFIQQLKQADFSSDSDVKMLYEQAGEIEKQIVNADLDKNAVDLDHLTEVSDKLNEAAAKRMFSVLLPSDEMKDRIIGGEGHNKHTIETLTGVDLIIDNTPKTITISSHDPVSLEIARLTLEKLIMDGRIHPARIEETVVKVKQELDVIVKEELKHERWQSCNKGFKTYPIIIS